ncbi:MAG TPA: 4Fe-4S binding protein [Patescibacteria group bacterium]|nr:4Fe-4S binding protein [Patescibacteria group bacterium]
MPVLINYKICDNAKDCSGISACLNDALSWDNRKKRIKIDNKKCVSCGLCEKACPVEAIKVAKNQKEYRKINDEIKNDPRKIGDLFVDRYGAQPISPAFMLAEKKFQQYFLDYDSLAIAEFYNDDSIRCLLKSIPVRDLIGWFNARYRKINVSAGLQKKYKINKLPAFLFFKKGKLIGKIEGFWEIRDAGELKGKIKKIKI